MSGILIPGDYDDWRWSGTPIDPPGGVSAAALTQIGATGCYSYLFTNNTALVFPDQQIPHDYKEETNIVSHIHFASSTTATYTGTWTLTYVDWLSVADGTAMSGPTTVTAAFNKSMTANQAQTQDFSAVMAGLNRKISSCATFTLTLTLSAGTGLFLLGCDGHYIKDRLGSKTITAK